MKTKIIIAAVIAAIALMIVLIPSDPCTCSQCTCEQPCKCDGNCGDGNCCTPSCGVDSTKIPLNLTVFVDLSDRMTKDSNGTTQLEKDMAIINQLADFVSKKSFSKNIKTAKDCFRVKFYPAPTDATINSLAENLDVDLSQFSKTEMEKKMSTAHDLAKTVNDNMKVIYDNSMKQANYIGCDIWGFFNTKAKPYCVKDGYRNVLVVLTDGYIYHINNLIKEENVATYITPQTLMAKTALKPCHQDLSDLEVLFLEVNAEPQTDFVKLQETISEWLKGMKVKKFDIVETDLPTNTKTIIDSFLKIK